MSVDWARFVASLRELFQDDGRGPTMASPDEPWAQFREVVAQSEYADQLQPLVGCIDKAPVDALERIEAMLALVQLVSPWSGLLG